MAAGSQLVGQTLGHYRILEQIGAGGMGVVYRAHDEQLERDVAIKVLPVGTLTDEAARKRFRKEALTLAKLSHPNIATIFEFNTQNGKDYLVTEYISGLTLDEKLAAGALSEKEVVSLGIQLAQGLGAAHEHGIVHRDLKPANLRLTSDGRLKILDFGLAQLMPHASDLGLTATLTQSQEVTGTLPYMAPEQLRAGVADARSDIWAAGAVLYEMATAHRPFEERVPTALVDDIIHKAPPSPRTLRPTLSPKLSAVILKCLEKEQVQRYQSARELQTDLERLSTGGSPLAARLKLWPAIATCAIVVTTLAVGAFFYLHRRPKLTEKDTMVLTDFVNTTGESVFDDTLKQGLRVQMEQSPFLNIVSDQKVDEQLKLMGRSAGERLTLVLAQDLCQRVGSKAVLKGSISRLGKNYVIGLSASKCDTGDELSSEQVEVDRQEHVLGALGESTTKMRKKLGESLATIQKYDAPIEQATTPSLEALKAYSQGMKTLRATGVVTALPFFQRAVELDPKFAMAHVRLGTVYAYLRQSEASAENTRKAYELRAKVSERERLHIEAEYYKFVIGDQDKVVQFYEVWQQTYPQDVEPYHQLTYLYARLLGKYEASLDEARKAVRLEPDNEENYSNLCYSYRWLNRLNEAGLVLKEAELHKLESKNLLEHRYDLAFLKNDKQEIKRLVDTSSDRQAVDYFRSLDADAEIKRGRLRKARQLSQCHVCASLNLAEAHFGLKHQARVDAAAALKLTEFGYSMFWMNALALALAGDSASVESLGKEMNHRYPQHTTIQRFWLPTLRAAIALERKDGDQALELLSVTKPYELCAISAAPLEPPYLRGQAYLIQHNGTAALVEFQKIIDHPGVLDTERALVGPLAHLGIARAYGLEGDTARSRIAYQDFLTLWKDADPDIPILKQAKAEYEKLQ
jgi:eukaryotic-like serine/threonine-protein kinase